jgi:hypothetical protein
MRLSKSEATSLKQIVRGGYHHIYNNIEIQVDADGKTSGQIWFIKLDRNRKPQGMMSLPLTGILLKKGA